MLKSTLLSTLVLVSSTLARPAEVLDEARAAVILNILKEADKNGQDVALVARQLFGGNDEYAPYEIPCPDGFTWVRPADSLGIGEQNFLEQRRPVVAEAFQKMMAANGLSQPPRTPVISFALSGGGYRAMTVGSGAVMATMNESSEAQQSGTGGWLDAVTYMAGLSGGSWATGTFIANGGQLPSDMIDNLWNLESNLIFPDDGKLSFYSDLVAQVNAKKDEDFHTQLTDYWGLAIGDHLNPEAYRLDTNPNFTLSNITNYVPSLAQGQLPMPIIIASEREPNELVIPENATTWEFTPYEFGSWAFGSTTKVRGAFTPVEYLGTRMNNGQVNGSCYKGFDQMSFVLGTSSTLFSGALLQLQNAEASGISGVALEAVQSILQGISSDENDIAQVRNSFKGYNSDNNPISEFDTITLVDAGLTNQNIPIEPLLIPQRNVDAIIAVDASADTTYSYPNGSALRTTFERAAILEQNQEVRIRMPAVPSVNGFINGGLNTRPVFFGCNDTDTPIIVYVPNYPWSYASNTSTYQLAYTKDEAHGVVDSGMRSLTLNGTVESWPRCLACALSDRSFSYTADNRTDECQACFNTWCWNGQDDDSEPTGEYTPAVGSTPDFLTANNLVSGSNNNAPAQSSQVQTTDSGASETPNAGTKVLMLGGWSVVVGLLGVMGGALAVVL